VRFAAWWFFPTAFVVAGAVALLLVIGGFRARRAVSRVGDEERVKALRTHDASVLRAWRGALLVAASFFAFVSAAQPQYGKGTRYIPRTNIDVVIVLDFSKSMYAQDVAPSRIFRSKVEVARLVKELRGARFGAVAFAGEPIGYPLTADGAAIAQVLRRLEPNDMPVGGTAIARALRYSHNMLARDPNAEKHKRVIVLVTDGEDLEGNPVRTARNIGAQGTTIHVVQIGGRTPEPLPAIGPDGEIMGQRRKPDGTLLTTQLSARGERQLKQIADATPGGMLIRAEQGSTGIEEITRELKKQMKSELSERVETEYADVYYIPLIIALLLLVLEAILPEGPYRRFVRREPPPRRRSRLRLRKRPAPTISGSEVSDAT